MKKVFYLIVLLILIFCFAQFGTGILKKSHEVSYTIMVGDTKYDISERFRKEKGEYYFLTISDGDNTFYYAIDNHFNKQKQIIKDIKSNFTGCIYPILIDNSGSYMECSSDGKLYTNMTYPNQNEVNSFYQSLQEQGYMVSKVSDLEETIALGNSTIYKNNLIEKDIITLWDYKGIQIIKNSGGQVKHVLNFDRYENKLGYLVGKYYVVPNYQNSKVLEFNSVHVISLETGNVEVIDLGNIFSSSTYCNGIIDGKLYYTDPSNLIQIEINPSKKFSRLIGNKEIGGQLYDGTWKDINIYDFVNNHILFQEDISILNPYSYEEVAIGSSSYYFVNSNKEVYQVLKERPDIAIYLFKVDGLHNLKVVDDTLYFVSGDTVYYYQTTGGVVPIIRNNEIRYNTTNRMDVFRKS